MPSVWHNRGLSVQIGNAGLLSRKHSSKCFKNTIGTSQVGGQRKSSRARRSAVIAHIPLLLTLPRLLPLAVSLHLCARGASPPPPPDARQAPSISLVYVSLLLTILSVFLPKPTSDPTAKKNKKTTKQNEKQKVNAAFWRLG